MKVKELIKKLQEVNQDLDVRVWADHGQADMKAGYVSVQYSEDDEYMIEGSYSDYKEFIEETECKDPYTFVSIS